LSKAKLFGLELKVLRLNKHGFKMLHWGVIVDAEGKVIEGGIREAVRRGLVREENYDYDHWWGLGKRANGDVYDLYGAYVEKDVVYGRMVDGVVVPV